MDSQQFVDVIRAEVSDSSVEEVINLLNDPPGRRPSQDLKMLSDWFKSLSVEDREKVRKVAEMSSDHATFGFFCVLDGVRVIEDGAIGGRLELWYEHGSKSVLLNDPDESFLHDLYR